MELEKVRTYFEEQAENFPGKVAYLYASAENPDEVYVASNEDKQVVSASTVKVPIMMALFDKLTREGIPVTTKILVTAEQILDDSRVFEYGPREASVEELIVWMIVNSDNTATNVLIQYIGMEDCNAYFKQMGLTKTRVERLMLDFKAVEEGRNNYISPIDFYHCMVYLRKQEKNNNMAKLALDILKRNRDFSSLCRYLYEGPVIAHKSGGLDDIVHDAGIVYTENVDYFLGVFVSDFKPEMEKEAEKLIGRMSRIIFDYTQN